jgi:hypothetical protein
MYHKLPFPLNRRRFVELVVSGVYTKPDKTDGGDVVSQFVVVQIPVDLTTFPPAYIGKVSCVDPKGRIQGDMITGGASPAKDEGINWKCVTGAYTSVSAADIS